jgi:hypothetical protein
VAVDPRRWDEVALKLCTSHRSQARRLVDTIDALKAAYKAGRADLALDLKANLVARTKSSRESGAMQLYANGNKRVTGE